MTTTATRTHSTTVLSKPARVRKTPKVSKQLEITDATPAATADKAKKAKASAKVKTFKDLGTWQAAYDLALAVGRQVETFPVSEKALSIQITDTTVSICSNIAEAFNHRSLVEKDCFYESAQGLLTKLANQLLVAHGLGYINTAQHEDLARRGSLTHWILGKLQRINHEWANDRG
jgi:four helix bundle protein